MTSIGPIDFESVEGYSYDEYLGDETDWNDRELTTGTSGERARIDTHTDHKSGQVVDHSGKGSTINIHQTSLAGANHSAQIEAFTDSMSGQDGGYDGLGVWLRGSNDGSSATSGYSVSIRRTAVGTDKTTLRIDYIVNDGSTNTNVYESSDISGTYSETEVHTLFASIDGDTVTIKVNGTTEATHDISGDAAQHDTGNYVGVVIEREYQKSWQASNCQPFLDEFEAEDLAATGSVRVGAQVMMVT